jgi:Glucose / Sorbosone dehydrogenase
MPHFLLSLIVWLVFIEAASAAPLTRIAANSLTLPATVPSYAYTTEPAFGGVKFSQPTLVVFAPGESSRAFVLEREGRVAVVRDTTRPTREIFLDLTAKVGNGAAGADNGLLSLAFHPQFATNGFFYVWHSLFVSGTRFNRLARYTRSWPRRLRAERPLLVGPRAKTPLVRLALRDRRLLWIFSERQLVAPHWRGLGEAF